MLAMTYTLPPFAEPCIALSRTRTPSPVREGPDAPDTLISGVKLIVSKLPRNGITATTNYLWALLREYNLRHPSDPVDRQINQQLDG
jgi:hypothetical protein